MNTHPEALRLADELDVGDFDVVTNYEAASELRRLHEENERLKAATPVQEPVKPSLWERYHEAQTTTPPAALVQLAWVWQQAPVKTQWGHDMVVADLAIDKDHTVSIYCELDQTSKVEAMFTPPAAPVQEPVAWINWCAATGKRSVSFECESELASQPLYEGITQNAQYHYSKFHSWFDSELHRQKYTQDHPAYLAAQEAWNAANDAAQHRINRLNAEIEAWKVRFKIAEDALAKLNGAEQKPVAWVGSLKDPQPHCVTDLKYCSAAQWDTGYHLKYIPLYTSPPASKPLTDEQIEQCMKQAYATVQGRNLEHAFARAIEAAHGITGETK